ncbi:cadherin-like domain-containing protein [Oscillatoria sp. FACHB-1407]|uniref:Ig-like domain-containing protein n=1 Tax=Oscillatoria sp. FACHB-1407 TaxID=2692847 RepID=UPI001683878C|nr:Ig-like domain-containing protein [Oscillatoria sp. FACHB-1407]MBD2461908.1 cadherin-like domain-containing protein [Oscillatoria sp. FACHB-1407]
MKKLAIAPSPVSQQQRRIQRKVAIVQLTKLDNFNSAIELWKLEGIIGSNNNRELFLSQNGSVGTNPDNAEWVWVSGQTYHWRLTWDGNIARFALFSGALDASPSEILEYDVVNTLMDGLQLSTKVDTRDPNRVSSGTTVNLSLHSLNGQVIDSSFGAEVTAVGNSSGVVGNNLYLAISEQLTTLDATGTVRFSWSGINPQTAGAGSRVSFQLEANDLPEIPTNSAPIATDDEAVTNEETAIPLLVLSNDSDPNGDSLTITVLNTIGLQGSVSQTDSSLTYIPAATFQSLAVGQSVIDTFSYTVRDTSGATDTATVNVTVQGVNDAPVLANPIGDRTITAGVPLALTLPAITFTDVDQGDVLSWTATLENGSPLPTWLQFDALTRSFSGTPTNIDAGTLAIRVTATDANNAVAQDIFALTITAASNPDPGGTPTPPPPAPTQGTPTRDRLLGTNTNDTLLGLDGNDTLMGRDGSDVLKGGRGNDTLIGEGGRDRLLGGLGRDIFVLQAKSGLDIIQDFKNGQDRLRLTGRLRFQDLTLRRQGRHVLIGTRQESLALLQGVAIAQINAADFA